MRRGEVGVMVVVVVVSEWREGEWQPRVAEVAGGTGTGTRTSTRTRTAEGSPIAKHRPIFGERP
jgi:hypothetical protein